MFTSCYDVHVMFSCGGGDVVLLWCSCVDVMLSMSCSCVVVVMFVCCGDVVAVCM